MANIIESDMRFGSTVQPSTLRAGIWVDPPCRGHRFDNPRSARTSPTTTAGRQVIGDYPRINPDVGTPVPAVTSTCSTSSTWLTDVPRSCRTPSAMPFMPWMYASPS